MSMWFFDEFPESAEFQRLEKEIRAVEQEYLELRQLRQQAQKALAANPQNPEIQAQVHYLEKRLKGLEEKFPWLLWVLPVEMALFAPPHG